MAHHIFELLRGYLAAYGYWTLAIVLLLENAGLPVPGETILLMASFLAYSEHRLTLPYIIVVGVCAATLGDNIGFLIGHYGGRPLLARYRKALHISPHAISQGERLLRRYGAVTVFFARFIAGLRVINGPLAGVLRMHWRKFLLFNFLGAAAWVIAVSSAGYFFGQKWQELAGILSNFSLALILILIAAFAFFWWRRRRRAKSPQTPSTD